MMISRRNFPKAFYEKLNFAFNEITNKIKS